MQFYVLPKKELVNNIKTKAKNQKMAISKMKKVGKKTGTTLKSILDGSILARGSIVKAIPFFIFLAFTGTLLIGNTYVAERNSRSVERAKAEIAELRIKQKLTRSELMRITNQSDLVQRLATRGIKPSTVPPTRIYDENNSKGFLRRIFN